MTMNPMIYIEQTPGKGVGVFARMDIPAGTVIENSPVILVPDPGWKELEKTALKDYYFAWDDKSVAIVLGYGALYNHSNNPNADVEYLFEERRLNFVALRDVRRGEEICFDYRTDEMPELWFDVVQS